MLKREIGNKGEDIAVKILKKKGYRIIERNFNVPGMGELDIVAKKKEYLVFVEVRLRKNTLHGSGAETIDIFKQKKLIKAALMYMKVNKLDYAPARFDVVSITGDIDGEYSVELIENAFEANI
ncbi:MAG: YraN family protein [Clostridia bacterium]|nr:YraN family protein [Clostridia bacterium]